MLAALRGPRAGMGYGVGSELVTWLDYCVQRAAFFVCVNPSRVAAYWAYIQGEAHAVKLCRADVVYVHAVDFIGAYLGCFAGNSVADCQLDFRHFSLLKRRALRSGLPGAAGCRCGLCAALVATVSRLLCAMRTFFVCRVFCWIGGAHCALDPVKLPHSWMHGAVARFPRLPCSLAGVYEVGGLRLGVASGCPLATHRFGCRGVGAGESRGHGVSSGGVGASLCPLYVWFGAFQQSTCFPVDPVLRFLHVDSMWIIAYPMGY